MEAAAGELARLAGLVLDDALGPRTRVAALGVLATTAESAVLTVRLAATDTVLALKLVRAEERPRTDLTRTAAASVLAHSAGVAVPEVVAVESTGRVQGWQYLLQEHVTGSSWQAVRPQLGADALAQAHGQIAATLISLRSLPLAGFGELAADGTTERATLPDALRRRVGLRVTRPAARAVAEDLLDRYADSLAAGPPVLSHDDLHHDNLLFRPSTQGWRLAAVLDWDHGWAGPPESDLGRVAFWDDMTGPGFWPVYRAQVPESPGEGERLAVHQLLWCLEYDVATPRHQADTAALARRLGVSPPAPG